MNAPETPRLSADSIKPWARARKVWEQAQPARPRHLPEHVGAWLDRMLDEPIEPGPREEKDPHADRRWLYLDAVAALTLGADGQTDPPAIRSWRVAYARHAQTFGEGTDPAIQRLVIELEAKTRVLLHAATERTVTEGGVLLHHTYGVPYLPGSALKGVLRKALSGRAQLYDISKFLIDDNIRAIDVLLGKGNTGTDDMAGLVDLLDALWIPERPSSARGAWSPLCVDVVTPHHSRPVGKEPTDLDSPIPTHRLTLAPGCRFRVVLEASPEFPAEWLRWLGEEVLPEALAEDGLGAWTSAGYGRLNRPGTTRRPPVETASAPAASPAVWLSADLSRKPNTGELSARLADGRVSRAAPDRARTLLDPLPGNEVDLLRAGKAIKVEVQVEPLGKTWGLVAIRGRGAP